MIDVSVTLSPVFGEEVEPVVWTIKGRVREILHLSSRCVSYTGAREIIRGATQQTTYVEIKSGATLDRLTADGERDLGDICLERLKEGGPYYRLMFTPNANRPYGPFSSFIDLHASIAGGGSYTQRLPIKGIVVPDVCAIPSVLRLEPLNPGGKASHNVVLRSRTGNPFSLRKSQVESGDVSVTVAGESTLANERSLWLTIGGTPRTDTMYEVVFDVYSSKFGGVEVELRLIFDGR